MDEKGEKMNAMRGGKGRWRWMIEGLFYAVLNGENRLLDNSGKVGERCTVLVVSFNNLIGK